MTRITLIDLSDGTAPSSVVTALPTDDTLTVPLSGDSDVSAIRAILSEAVGRTDGFVIAFGGGDGGSPDAMHWPTVAVRLRRAFGVLTGAASGLDARGGGPIAILLPSFALLPPTPPTAAGVWLRAILGMAEALRAELGSVATRVGIVFYQDAAPDPGLGNRVQHILDHGAMYSLSPDLTAARIHAYFDPMLAAVGRASAGPPLPEIGPMAVVYDLAAIGPAPKG